jgi:hypothetical protein
MPDESTPVVEGFFAELGASRFFSEYWPGTPCQEHGDPDRLHALFRSPLLADFEALAQNYRGPTFYFAREASAMRPIDRPPAQLYREGRTIYFGNVEPFIHGASEFLRGLERELGVKPGCARIGVFASPQDDGATIHYDTNDVFSIQIKGDKQFNIAPVKELSYPAGTQYSQGTAPLRYHYPQMQHGFPDPSSAEYECVDMKPGTVLYMPRGMWHHTFASAESIAVSIIVNPPLAVDMILEHLKVTLLQKQEWREPVYGIWNETPPASSKQKVASLIEELRTVTQNLDVESVVRSADDQNLRLDSIDENTRFQTIPTASFQFQKTGEDTQVTVIVTDLAMGARNTGSITVNDATRKILEWISCRRAPFSTQQLASEFNVSTSDVCALLRILCASEVLMPLWFDLIQDP